MSFTVRAFQGISVVYTVQISNSDGSPAVNIFTGAEQLAGVVWPGDEQPATFTFTPTWNSGPLGLVDLPIVGSLTTSVNPGFYELIVKLADSSEAIAYGSLDVQAVPGTESQSLVSIPYVRAALADTTLSQAQVDFLPYAIQSSCKFIKRYCGDRDFIQKTYVKEYMPALDGQVRLDQIPVNQVIRVQGDRDSAMTIAMTDAAVTSAWCNWSYTGDYERGITITGLNLYSQANGVQTVQNVPFSSLSPPTVQSLADAVNALSSPSWVAQVNGGYAGWPVTELIGGDVAQGAIWGNGVSLDVYCQDLNNCRLYSADTGILYVGYTTSAYTLGPTWGPDWIAFDYPPIPPGTSTKVKVTYNAGFASVPDDVQGAAAELTKYFLGRLNTDFALERERLGDYEYVLRKVWPGMPDSVKHVLSLYRITNA